MDPVRYAEAFGAVEMMIQTADQIPPTLKRAMETAGPVIIGVHVDYSDNQRLFESVDKNFRQKPVRFEISGNTQI